jgi:hypothetical protein
MEIFRSTLLLCPVIVLQFLLCLCRWHHADFLGLAKDGAEVIIGVVTVYEATPTPALLYAVLCFSGFFYDAVVSMQWLVLWMNTRIGYANFKGAGALLELTLVASAPIVSAVAAVLAGRIYFLSRAASRAELHPLVGSSTGETYGKQSQTYASAGQYCGMLSWPSAPAPPAPPLCGGVAEPARSPPFRAIFGTPLPKSPRSALAERTPLFHHEEPGAVL